MKKLERKSNSEAAITSSEKVLYENASFPLCQLSKGRQRKREREREREREWERATRKEERKRENSEYVGTKQNEPLK